MGWIGFEKKTVRDIVYAVLFIIQYCINLVCNFVRMLSTI